MSSKRHVRKRSCKNKKTYDTYQQAERAAARQVDDIEYQDNLHPYECSFCGHYHVGHRTMTRACSVPAYSRFLRDRM